MTRKSSYPADGNTLKLVDAFSSAGLEAALQQFARPAVDR